MEYNHDENICPNCGNEIEDKLENAIQQLFIESFQISDPSATEDFIRKCVYVGHSIGKTEAYETIALSAINAAESYEILTDNLLEGECDCDDCSCED